MLNKILPNKNTSIEEKVAAIHKKQELDPFYIPNSIEKKVLSKWSIEEREKIKQREKALKEVVAKNKKLEKRKKVKTIIPKSTQMTIPFLTDYEEVFEVAANKYSKTYHADNFNYKTAKKEEQEGVFFKFGDFLNYFSENMNVALTIDNRVVSMKEQEEAVLCPVETGNFEIHAQEYNRYLKKQLIAGRNDIQQSIYISVTVDSDTPYEAIQQFRTIDAEVQSNLKRMGSRNRILSTDERLSLLHDKFRKGREGEFKVNYEFLKEQGLSSKDYIAPSSFYFDTNHFIMGNEYYRCMTLNNFPAKLADDFLTELTNCDFPTITTLNIQPMAQDKALRLVRKQLTGMQANKIEMEKKAVRSGYSPDSISHNLKQSMGQAEWLLDMMINDDQKMFLLTFVIMVNGKNLQELDDNCKIIEGKARKFTFQPLVLSHQQEEAFKVALPVGYPPTQLKVDRTITTRALSIFMPFSNLKLFQKGGYYYGLNQMNNDMILCNRTAMKTPSGFILGSSGSGKSFATKREMLNVLLKDSAASVLVVDPENEYGEFARAFGGTTIDISASSSNFINPMDLELEYGNDSEDINNDVDIKIKMRNALQSKSEYLMSLIEAMVTNNAGGSYITPQQKTMVDRAVTRAYERYVKSEFNPEFIPTLVDLQNELDKERNNSKEADELAEAVEYYTKGSMNMFSHKTNVNYKNRFVVFNIRDLGEQLKQIALLIVLDFIWNRMLANFQDGIRTYCYVDEIHVLFHNEFSGKFLQQLYKRGRKYGLVITGITQNVEDLLRYERARGMIGNSDFIMMLNQNGEDLDILAKLLSISDELKVFISKAQEGEGLLFAENVIVPFKDKFSKDSYLYKLMSTKFGEAHSEDIVYHLEDVKTSDKPRKLNENVEAEPEPEPEPNSETEDISEGQQGVTTFRF